MLRALKADSVTQVGSVPTSRDRHGLSQAPSRLDAPLPSCRQPLLILSRPEGPTQTLCILTAAKMLGTSTEKDTDTNITALRWGAQAQRHQMSGYLQEEVPCPGQGNITGDVDDVGSSLRSTDDRDHKQACLDKLEHTPWQQEVGLG